MSVLETQIDEEFPSELLSFFMNKRATIVVTPAVIHSAIGTHTISLEKYDVFAVGKRKGLKEYAFWTKLRIVTKASARNNVQGFLGVQFLAGYGFKKMGYDSSVKIMRPTDIQKLITEDTASLKKRSVIDLGGGVFIPLWSAECFCRIPLMDDCQMSTHEKSINSRKREAYARKKATENGWAHVNREGMKKEQKKHMHRMLIPYKKNLHDSVFFDVFMNDIVAGCLQLKQEFCPGEDNNRVLDAFQSVQKVHGKKRKTEDVHIINDLSHQVDTIPLKRIPSSDINW